MAKVPGAVPVKSRLHGALGEPGATELYRRFLLDRIASLAALANADVAIAFTPPDAAAAMAALAPGIRLLAQRGRDLGERMANVVSDLAAGGAAGVVVVGSDSPALPVERIADAAASVAAGRADVVLAPAEDGGYCLVALWRPRPEIFEDIPWSTADVLARTLERARRLGLSVQLLPPCFDVDTETDLRRLRADLASRAGAAPLTAEFVRRLFP